MSGHSKFANIKHKKEKNDAAKGKIFTIIGREIAVAVKEGGPDPANNSKLRDVIAKAKSNNMPNDTIERGIKKAAGDASAVNYVTITYEGYGPNGTAIIVDALTDNKNRTAANVKNAFTKGGGNVGTPGCVSFMFDKKGQIIIDKEEFEGDADELMMTALDAGAEDFNEEEDRETLLGKIHDVLAQVGENDVLFCCDLVGGTPFNVAAEICAEKSNFCCVGGLNTMAYLSMQYELESSAFELADMACGVAKEAVMRFPPAEA